MERPLRMKDFARGLHELYGNSTHGHMETLVLTLYVQSAGTFEHRENPYFFYFVILFPAKMPGQK
jgi:hypothetical protein